MSENVKTQIIDLVKDCKDIELLYLIQSLLLTPECQTL
jgi:hypothetical protein